MFLVERLVLLPELKLVLVERGRWWFLGRRVGVLRGF
jgi:hypothetical protein